MTDRLEHIKFCKQRAIQELEADGPVPLRCANAYASMVSDLGKHEETLRVMDPVLASLGMEAVAAGDVAGVRKWIEGFVSA